MRRRAGVAALLGRHEGPWVVKPRFGAGSSGVTFLASPGELSRWKGDGAAVRQQFVATDRPELTAA